MKEILILAVSYFTMEIVAKITHRHVMHGFLWDLHKDHHIKFDEVKKIFERNDLFFLIYALPAIALIITGVYYENSLPLYAGTGITLYGLTYFLLHDIMIHGRLGLNIKFRTSYLRAVERAHLSHHQTEGKRLGASYGLLIFPRIFFKQD